VLRITVADVSQAMLGQILDAGVAGRNARRAKNETSARADHAIASQFGDSQERRANYQSSGPARSVRRSEVNGFCYGPS
jgi:hypothetical protein